MKYGQLKNVLFILIQCILAGQILPECRNQFQRFAELRNLFCARQLKGLTPSHGWQLFNQFQGPVARSGLIAKCAVFINFQQHGAAIPLRLGQICGTGAIKQSHHTYLNSSART
jgi:hypothetical protein